MDSEARAEIVAPERAAPGEERMEQLARELEPLARRLARRWAREHALHQAGELLARYQPLVHKVAFCPPW